MRITRSIRQFFVRVYKSFVALFQTCVPENQKSEIQQLDTNAHILTHQPPQLTDADMLKVKEELRRQYQGANPINLSFTLNLTSASDARVFIFRQRTRKYIPPIPLYDIVQDWEMDQEDSPLIQAIAQDTVAVPVPSKSGAVFQKGAVYQFYDRQTQTIPLETDLPAPLPVIPSLEPNEPSQTSLLITPATPTSPRSLVSFQSSNSDPILSPAQSNMSLPISSPPLSPLSPVNSPPSRRRSLRQFAQDVRRSLSVVGPEISHDDLESSIPLQTRRPTLANIRRKSTLMDTKTGTWSQTWIEIGATEKKYDVNPSFTKTVQILFGGGGFSPIYRILVVDVTSTKNPGWGGQKFIGYADVNIGSIVFGALLTDGRKFELKTEPPADFAPYLRSKIGPKPKVAPIITVFPSGVAMPSSQSTASVRMFIEAEHIEKRDVFGHSDAYITVARAIGNDLDKTQVKTWIPVYKSEVVDKEENPIWQPFTLGIDQLCQGNLDKLLRFEVWDHDFVKPHDMIGYACTTLRRIEGSGHILDLIIPRKENRKGYVNSGVLVFKSVEIMGRDIHLIDFLVTGTQIGFIVAMDFTTSNGSITDSQSAHWYNPNRNLNDVTTLNRTEKLLVSLTSFLESYSEDHKTPFLGFGAKVPVAVGFRTSYCFAVNGNDSNPVCDLGTYGVLQTYHDFLSTVEMSRPSNICEVLKRIKEGCTQIEAMGAADRKLKQYSVALIFLDSVPNDLPEALKLMLDLETLPVSLVFLCMSLDEGRKEKFRAIEECLKNPRDWIGKPLPVVQSRQNPTMTLTGIIQNLSEESQPVTAPKVEEDEFYYGQVTLKRTFVNTAVYAYVFFEGN
jgi:hypothetical protein